MLRSVPTARASSLPAEEHRRLTCAGYGYSYRLLRSAQPRTEPVVLLGGALQDRYAWLSLEPRLLAAADVMTIDLPGWGDTDPLPDEYGMDFLADALAHALDDAGIASVNVVGACYGAVIATFFGTRHPHRSARMVLGSVQHELSAASRSAFERALAALHRDEMDTFLRIVLDLYLPPEQTASMSGSAGRRRTAIGRLLRQQMRRLSDRELENYLLNTRRLLRLSGPLPTPTARTLVINGEDDLFTPPAGGRSMAMALTDAVFAVVEGVGHMMALERPSDIAELLATYVTDGPLADVAAARVESSVTAGRPG